MVHVVVEEVFALVSVSLFLATVAQVLCDLAELSKTSRDSAG